LPLPTPLMIVTTLTLGLIPARAALPAGWTESKVGHPPAHGSESFADGTYPVTGLI
jgi:hypothetical protein